MDALAQSHRTLVHRLVLVADGAKALVLADSGIPPAPKLAVMETLVEPHPSTAEQGTDRPGRVHESATTARSAVETTDFHAEAEAAFLKRVAERLEEAMAASGAERLLLVAPPKALGTLREALGPQARARLDGEVAKDLVRMTVDEITQRIAT